jgi:hypothetical protein
MERFCNSIRPAPWDINFRPIHNTNSPVFYGITCSRVSTMFTPPLSVQKRANLSRLTGRSEPESEAERRPE